MISRSSAVSEVKGTQHLEEGHVNKDVFAILEPGNPLMTRAVDALKLCYQAMAAKLSVEEGWAQVGR